MPDSQQRKMLRPDLDGRNCLVFSVRQIGEDGEQEGRRGERLRRGHGRWEVPPVGERQG